MDRIKFYIEKYKLYILISFLILLILIIVLFKTSNKKSNNIEVISTLSSAPIEKVNKEEKKDTEESEDTKVIVDIKGYVNSPGVYELSSNKRIIDVINMAGGLKEEANTDYINLSKKVTDEMIIVIYSNNDVEKYKKTSDKVIYIEYECICPDNINDACITENDTVNTVEKDNKESNDKSNEISDKKDDKISINNATIEELMTLSGIGEAKAKAIIKYREDNGLFKNIEDIKNVSGIGDSAYEKIKDYIKL